MCVCARVRARACVRACVCERVRLRVCVCVYARLIFALFDFFIHLHNQPPPPIMFFVKHSGLSKNLRFGRCYYYYMNKSPTMMCLAKKKKKKKDS